MASPSCQTTSDAFVSAAAIKPASFFHWRSNASAAGTSAMLITRTFSLCFKRCAHDSWSMWRAQATHRRVALSDASKLRLSSFTE